MGKVRNQAVGQAVKDTLVIDSLATLLILGTLPLAAGVIVLALRPGRRAHLQTAGLLALLLLALAALIADNAQRGVWNSGEWALFAVALLLVAAGILAALRGSPAADAARPRNRRGGWQLVGAGGALLMMVALIPVIAAARSLQSAEPAPVPTSLAAVTASPTDTITAYDRAVTVFDQVTQLIAEEAGLDATAVAQQLDAGTTVTQLVSANNGDLERVILGISAILSDQVTALAASGDLDPTAAALALAQMENVVRIGVATRLAGLLERFDAEDRPGAEATPEASAVPTG